MKRLAEFHIIFATLACVVYQRIGVVRCCERRVFSVDNSCTGCSAKRVPFEHTVDAYRIFALQKFKHTHEYLTPVASSTLAAPYGLIVAAQRRTYERSIVTEFCHSHKMFIGFLLGIHVYREEIIGKCCLHEAVFCSSSKCEDFTESSLLRTLDECFEVRLVIFLNSMRLLNLHDGYIATVCKQLRREFLTQSLEKAVDTLHECRLLAAESYSIDIEQPPRQTTHIPFGTDIRAYVQPHKQSLLLSKTTECLYILHPRKIEITLGWFVQHPRHLHRNGIETHACHIFEPVAPILLRHTRIVKIGRCYGKNLTIKGYDRIFDRNSTFFVAAGTKTYCGNKKQYKVTSCSEYFHLLILTKFYKKLDSLIFGHTYLVEYACCILHSLFGTLPEFT